MFDKQIYSDVIKLQHMLWGGISTGSDWPGLWEPAHNRILQQLLLENNVYGYRVIAYKIK